MWSISRRCSGSSVRNNNAYHMTIHVGTRSARSPGWNGSSYVPADMFRFVRVAGCVPYGHVYKTFHIMSTVHGLYLAFMSWGGGRDDGHDTAGTSLRIFKCETSGHVWLHFNNCKLCTSGSFKRNLRNQNQCFQPQRVIPTIAVVVFVPQPNQSVSIVKKQALKLDPKGT